MNVKYFQIQIDSVHFFISPAKLFLSNVKKIETLVAQISIFSLLISINF